MGLLALCPVFPRINVRVEVSGRSRSIQPLGRDGNVGIDDKAKNKIEEIGGKLKVAIGKATDDEGTVNEGKLDQVKSNLKDAGEKVKDAFREK